MVKTAISLPNETFDRVSARARKLGMSRSEFFGRAATRYLDELDESSVTAHIDEALALGADADDSSSLAVAAGRHTLVAADGW